MNQGAPLVIREDATVSLAFDQARYNHSPSGLAAHLKLRKDLILARLRLSFLLVAGFTVLPVQLRAQGEELAAGIQAADLHDFAGARRHFETVLRRDPASYDANWRMALLLIDIAKQVPDNVVSQTRDSL